jgi:hypothetical protein
MTVDCRGVPREVAIGIDTHHGGHIGETDQNVALRGAAPSAVFAGRLAGLAGGITRAPLLSSARFSRPTVSQSGCDRDIVSSQGAV